MGKIEPSVCKGTDLDVKMGATMTRISTLLDGPIGDLADVAREHFFAF